MAGFRESIAFMTLGDKHSKNLMHEERRVIEGTEQGAARKHGEIHPDLVTRRTHKEKKIIWMPIGDTMPSEIADAVFCTMIFFVIDA